MVNVFKEGRYAVEHPKFGYLFFDTLLDAAKRWNDDQSMEVLKETKDISWASVDRESLIDALVSSGIAVNSHRP